MVISGGRLYLWLDDGKQDISLACWLHNFQHTQLRARPTLHRHKDPQFVD